MNEKGVGKTAASAIIICVIILGFLGYWYGIREKEIKPSIKGLSSKWGSTDENSTEIISTVTIHNPNPIGIDVKTLSYVISANELEMATGGTEAVHLAGGQDSNVRVITALSNDNIPKFWADHINRGESTTFKVKGFAEIDLKAMTYTYRFEQGQEVKTDILTGLNTEKDKTYTFGPEAPRSLPIEITCKSLSSRWGKVTETETKIDHKVVLYNHEEYPIPISRLKAVTEMNEIKVATSETYNPAILHSKEDTTVPFETAIKNRKLVDWWPTHIQNEEKTKIKSTIYAVFDTPTAFERLGAKNTYEIKVAEVESILETNFLGQK